MDFLQPLTPITGCQGKKCGQKGNLFQTRYIDHTVLPEYLKICIFSKLFIHFIKHIIGNSRF